MLLHLSIMLPESIYFTVITPDDLNMFIVRAFGGQYFIVNLNLLIFCSLLKIR